ncbi:hypothetical protein COV93_05930 [Candidatus Woesearchaeota archaeon CG11_big_fil_rev_8_21_14_0_20_43_8]|nr:MAG: hypothetical protein COV93_05930 [Candidatus Woesearchaeota archaeon CG11_big_fil_rev_8_21_14_0_20_43_8]PIO05593.1 MAG: hypothetical protein COT47_04140 [Candidatus Woesearchaeota archaeon CG08_land_8_20_14_0_20_43_7]
MMDIAGLSNAMTDVIIEVTENELKDCRLRKGVFNDSAEIDQEQFFDIVQNRPKINIPGGSAANALKSASKLGLDTSLFCTVGDDDYGREYIADLTNSGVKPIFDIQHGPSGLVYLLVTPDHEKSCIAKGGVSGIYGYGLTGLSDARFFHTTGYELLSNPNRTIETIEYARSIGAKVSYDLAAPFAVEARKKDLETLLMHVDVLFASDDEAESLTNLDYDASLDALTSICPIVIMKFGKNGSIVAKGDQRYKIPIYKVKLVNTNGAGDTYSAGFLYGMIKGKSLEECGHMGSRYASVVCGRKEAHL